MGKMESTINIIWQTFDFEIYFQQRKIQNVRIKRQGEFNLTYFAQSCSFRVNIPFNFGLLFTTYYRWRAIPKIVELFQAVTFSTMMVLLVTAFAFTARLKLTWQTTTQHGGERPMREQNWFTRKNSSRKIVLNDSKSKKKTSQALFISCLQNYGSLRR